MLLLDLALILGAFKVGLVATTGVDRTGEPAPGLCETLGRRAEEIKRLPRDSKDRLVASEELVGGLEALLWLITDNLQDVVNDYSLVYQQVLDPVINLSVAEVALPPKFHAYADRYRVPNLLVELVDSYMFALKSLGRIAPLFRRAQPSSLQALAALARSSIAAMQVGGRVKLYLDHILYSGSQVFDGEQANLAEQPLEVLGRATRAKRELDRLICNDYEELAGDMTELIDQIVDNLEQVLKSLKASDRAEIYSLFKRWLEDRLKFVLVRSPETMRFKDNFESENRRRLAETQAFVYGRIFWRLLKFRLECPELDHNGSAKGILFPKDSEIQRIIGPMAPVSGEDWKLGQFEGDAACLDPDGSLRGPSVEFKIHARELRRWAHSTIYLGALPNKADLFHVPRENTEELVDALEDDLCLILDTIGRHHDGQRRRYMLGSVLRFLWRTVFVVERTLGILGKTERSGGSPGRLLRKLERMVNDDFVGARGPGVKSARKARARDALQADGSTDHRMEGSAAYNELSSLLEERLLDPDQETVHGRVERCSPCGRIFSWPGEAVRWLFGGGGEDATN